MIRKIDIYHNPSRYENIFNMYEIEEEGKSSYVFYNISNTVKFPSEIDRSAYDYYTIDSSMAYTTLSHIIYGNQTLWWVIVRFNNIKNPVKMIKAGSVLKIIKPEYINEILDSIR
jgi:hypothetical protein